jgi:hypothetical protein
LPGSQATTVLDLDIPWKKAKKPWIHLDRPTQSSTPHLDDLMLLKLPQWTGHLRLRPNLKEVAAARPGAGRT